MGISIEQWRLSIGARTSRMTTEFLQTSVSSRLSFSQSARLKFILFALIAASISVALASALFSLTKIEVPVPPAPWQVLLKEAHLPMWHLQSLVFCSSIPVSNFKPSSHITGPTRYTSKCSPRFSSTWSKPDLSTTPWFLTSWNCLHKSQGSSWKIWSPAWHTDWNAPGLLLPFCQNPNPTDPAFLALQWQLPRYLQVLSAYSFGDYSLKLIAKQDPQINIHSLFSMITNFQNKYTYGNKKKIGIKIAHWN